LYAFTVSLNITNQLQTKFLHQIIQEAAKVQIQHLRNRVRSFALRYDIQFHILIRVILTSRSMQKIRCFRFIDA